MANIFGRYNYPSKGRAMQRFAEALRYVGRDLAESENRSRYSSQMAQAKAQSLRDMDDLNTRLHENRDKPEEFESVYEEWWKEHEKNVMSGSSGRAARDITNDLVVEKEELLNSIRQRARNQDITNNIVNTESLIDEHKKPRHYADIEELSQSLASFADATRIAMESGDLPELQTPEQHTQLFEEISSLEVSQYILQHPDKEPGDEYYINNPNKFADDFGFSSAFSKELFGPDEITRLKRDYETNKNINEYQAKAERERREAEVELEARKYILPRKDPEGNDIPPDWQAGIDIINGAMDELGSDWHTDALNKYKNAFSIMNTTGENPFTKTQSWSRFGEIRQDILNGRIKSEREIQKWTGGKDGYAIPQEKYLLDLYNGDESSAKAFEDSAAAQNLEKIIRYNIVEESDEPDLYQFTVQRGLGLLQDAINPEMTDREKKEEALRIGRQLERQFDEGILEEDLESMILKRQGLVKPEDVPIEKTLGLKEIWDELTARERRDALKALSQGRTPEEIIDYFNKNK